MELLAKRYYAERDELIPILVAKMSRADASARMRRISQLPGQRTGEAENGDMYFETETGDGTLVDDPIIFPHAVARALLLETGADPDLLDIRMTDAYAAGWLDGRSAL